MLVENFGVEADLLFGSKSVEHAANGIHLAGDGFGERPLRALENHVLDKVSEAVFLGNFTAGAVANPNADETERTWGMVSVRTTRPLGKTCF